MKKFKESFSAKLSVFTALIASLVFVICYSTNFYHAQKAVKEEAEKMAMAELDNAVLRIHNITSSVEVCASNLMPFIKKNISNPDEMFSLARMVVENNPNVKGCSISFEPDFFMKQKGHYFSAYAGRETDGSVTVEQEGSPLYEYFYMDWYQIPKLLNQPYWTDPYSDVYENEETGRMQIEKICSYGLPIHDDNGKTVGVLTIDIDQKWLSKIISNLKPYPDSYTIALGRGGVYLVHPDSTILGSNTVFTRYLDSGIEDIKSFGERMTDGGRGMMALYADVTGGEGDSYIFYTPLKQMGWSVGIVCPEKDIYGGLNSMKWTLVIMTAIGILVMMVVCIIFIRSRVKPLEHLAHSANIIARGNFTKAIPVIKGNDEIALLSKAFYDMQHSLVEYVEELKSTTAKKERIEGELRIAHDIQMGMIPKIFPPYPDREDIDIFASLTPAKEVGGDLYDFLILDNRFYFCIGDVSGKGIPASLLMAVCRNLFRTVAGQGLNPSQIVKNINDTMGESNESGMFITLFVGMIDLDSGRMTYCNAGHNPPVIVNRQGQASFMELVPNVPAGVFEGLDYEQQEMDTVDGLSIFLYTDGLTEAEDMEKKQYGEDRLIELLTESQGVSARELVGHVASSVRDFVREAEQSDDLTVMAVRIDVKK